MLDKILMQTCRMMDARGERIQQAYLKNGAEITNAEALSKQQKEVINKSNGVLNYILKQ